MCEEIMLKVSGIKRKPTAAILQGYSRRAVKGERYPALISDQKSQVKGLVYPDISAMAWARLDRFEGKMYRRETLNVTLSSGCAISADIYLTQPDFLFLLDSVEWDFATFLRRDKSHYLNRTL